MSVRYVVEANGKVYVCRQFEFRQVWLVMLEVEADGEVLHDRICIPAHAITEPVSVNKMEA